METGSDLGSEPTAAHERLNLTLDLEYAHVIGHSAICVDSWVNLIRYTA